MLPNCNEIRHVFGLNTEGRWAEAYYTGSDGQPNVIFRQEIQPNKPTKTPPGQVAFNKGFCQWGEPLPKPVAGTTMDFHQDVQAASVPNSPNSADAIAGLGVGAAIIIGMVVMAVLASYRLKPDPTLALPMAKLPMLLPPAPVPHLVADDHLDDIAAQNDNPPGEYEAIFKKALAYPVISVVGAQGTGKTTLVNWLASQLKGSVMILDPHAALNDWQGFRVIGKGMDYRGISEALTEANALTHERYQLRAEEGITDFPQVTYIAEELTNWADQVDGLAAFIRSSLSNFRKANQKLIKVSHGETNLAQGGSTGTAKMRGEGEVLVKLVAQGKALVSFPGEDALTVNFPLLKAPVSHLVLAPSSDIEELNRLFNLPTTKSMQGDPVNDFLCWLTIRKDAGKLLITYEQIKGSKIGKTCGRDRKSLMPLVNAAIDCKLLVEVGEDQWRIT